MRKRMIAGNWKMNNTRPEAVVLTQEIANRVPAAWLDQVDVVIIPPFIDLLPALTVLDFDKNEIAVGAQNCYWEDHGAFTGEVSVPMLKDLGVTYCIVGHSERRGLFGETDEDVNKKVKALLAGGITPIMCCGESLGIRDANEYVEFVTAQVDAGLAGLDDIDMKNVVIAYEPIWAIGTGRTATPEQAEEVCAAIRAKLRDMFGDETADATRILYGGSMKPENVDGLLAMEDIDGGLIGGASLKSNDFKALIEAATK
ncbi:MAG: triose-phosphate isomerase [Coriobacteriia bacterium]|nr:triose-phosphate isomerase [Coriobacteriia bacterium]